MNKTILILLSLITFVNVFSQEKYHIFTKDTLQFKLQHEVGLDSAIERDSLNVFYIDKLILSYLMKEKGGDCNSESLEIASYEINANHIVFYTFWCRKGDAPVSPYGGRIQEYNYQNHSFKMVSSKIYLETTRISWGEEKGIQFLFEKPESNSEQLEFESYIAKVEKQYHAKFVYGNDAKKLLQIVKKHLKKEIDKETAHWLDTPNSFGVKI